MEKTDKEILFDRLIDENRGRIYRICYSFLNNREDVADLFQEILSEIWKSIDRFRHGSTWSTYIYRITVNNAIKFKTKAAKNREISKESGLSEIPYNDEMEEVQQKESRLNQMHRCIQMLKDSDRLLISLVLEDLSYKEIAEILDSNANLVGVRINRIKKRIIKLMEKHYGPL
ncbi:MAG: RNA polymerase sigma factor [Balneolaceae bacterium]